MTWLSDWKLNLLYISFDYAFASEFQIGFEAAFLRINSLAYFFLTFHF